MSSKDTLSAINSDGELFLSSSGADILLDRIARELGSSITSIKRVEGGLNNRIFLLTDDVGVRYVAKLYRRDDRNRLEREYKACAFLLSHGFTVPTPYLKDEEHLYGVYSFEEGTRILDKDVQKRDIDFLVDFMVRIEQFTADTINESFDRGICSLHSAKELADDTHTRLYKVNAGLSQGVLHNEVSRFLESSGILRKTASLTEQKMSIWKYPWWEIQKNEARLSPVDVGLHNMLFRKDGPPCIIDLEYFGWDDPFNLIANFLTQDQSQALTQEMYDYTVHSYEKAMNLSQYQRERLRLVIDMFDIKWLAIYLTSLTPKYIESRVFASGDQFDIDKYVDEQIVKIQKRLIRIHVN